MTDYGGITHSRLSFIVVDSQVSKQTCLKQSNIIKLIELFRTLEFHLSKTFISTTREQLKPTRYECIHIDLLNCTLLVWLPVNPARR